MKKTIIAMLIVGLICLYGSVVFSEESEMEVYQFEDFAYTILDDGSIEITKWSGIDEEVNIPNLIDGRPVSSIGERAFTQERPDYELTYVTIPEGITTIRDYAFGGCYNLASINIPDSVMSIGKNPFSFCRRLTDIIVSSDQPAVELIDGVLFGKVDKRLICYPEYLGRSYYAIPAGTKIIGARAFSDNSFQPQVWDIDILTTVDVPASVEVIEEGAFSCAHIESIYLPEGLKEIGDRAFYECNDLYSIQIPESVQKIGDEVFRSCDSLYEIAIPNNTEIIGTNPFAYCKNLSSIYVSPEHPTLATIDGVLFSKPDRKLICYPFAFEAETYAIPQGIQIIGTYAFSGCDSVAKVIIPDSVHHIEDSAFADCDSLNDVVIPDSVDEIGKRAFSSCGKLSSIVIPGSIQTIGDGAFESSGLNSVVIPGSVQTIGDRAFKYSNLHSVTIEDGVLSVGEEAFFYCDDMRELSLPDSLTMIGANAFKDCDYVMEVVIPKGVSSIGDEAFEGCDRLQSVTIKGDVSEIGANPFLDCRKLTEIRIEGNPSSLEFIDGVLYSKSDRKLVSYLCNEERETFIVPDGIETIGNSAFDLMVSSPSSIILPSSLKRIEDFAFCHYEVTDIEIPEGTTYIGDHAFLYSYLRKVAIPDSVEYIGTNAFYGCSSEMVATVGRDSYAARYCSENEIEYIYPDSLDWLND